jgi:phosphate transport system substrate-binding protein
VCGYFYVYHDPGLNIRTIFYVSTPDQSLNDLFVAWRQVMQKKSCALILILLVPILLSACGNTVQTPETGDLKGTITVSGAFALYPMMTRWAEEFQKLHPQVQFDISGGGAGKGMTDVLSGAVDIGMVSRAIKPAEVSQGAFGVGVVKDAVFPVVNAGNPVIAGIMAMGITRDTFRKIFITSEIKTWGEVVGKPENVDEIHLYTRSDSAGAAEVWAQFLGGSGQADLQGIGVNGDPGLLDAVVRDPLGIGYNNLGYAFDLATGNLPAGAIVVPTDSNEDGIAQPDEIISTLAQATEAVASGRYPSPPARVLNLVTRGKPSGLVQTFLVWILTDGQAFVPEAGFVQLTPDLLAEALAEVK